MKKQATDPESVLDQLRGNPTLWKALLEGTPAGVVLVDKGFVVRDVNKAVLEWLGTSRREILGDKCHKVLFGSDDPCSTKSHSCPAVKAFAEKVLSGPSEFGRQTPEGDLQYLQIQTFPILDEAGEPLYALDFISDVTAEKLLHAFQEEAVLKDPLTGLYNRKAFHLFLDRELKRSQRQDHPLTVGLLDMDDFKDYNETHGEDAGNACLDVLAHVLLRSTRSEVDLVFRLEADLFALVLPEASPEMANSIRERILDNGNADELPVPFSMVLCQADPDEEARALFHRAEELLYRAKKSGNNRHP